MRISDWSSDVCSSDLRRHTAEVCLKQNRKVRGAKPHTEEQSAEGAAVAIADIRAERRMTLMDLSRRSGVAASTISRIENRQTSPTFTVLMKLADGLSVPVSPPLAGPGPRLAPSCRAVTPAGHDRKSGGEGNGVVGRVG